MTQDPLERLRAHDPADRLSSTADRAPDGVLQRILADGGPAAGRPHARRRRAPRSRFSRGLPTVGVAALALAMAAVFLFAGPHRASGPSRSAGSPIPGPTAPQRQQLEALERRAHRLDLSRATLLTPGAREQLWLMPSRDGRELCLVQTRVGFDAAGAGSGFSCQAEADARRRGIVSGVPGAWYGWAPPTQRVVQGTTPGGADVLLGLVNGTFRVPAPVRKLHIGRTATRYLPLPLARPHDARREVLTAFALLRGGARRATEQEAAFAQVQASQPLVPGAARVVAHTTSVGPLIAALSVEGGVCLTAASGGACSVPRTAASGAALSVPVPAAEGGGWRSFGLVPDGAHQVILAGRDEPSRQLDVTLNRWTAATREAPVTVAWTDADANRWTLALAARRR